MNEFQDKYFVTSFCSLIRMIILNKNNEVQSEYILNTLQEIIDDGKYILKGVYTTPKLNAIIKIKFFSMPTFFSVQIFAFKF